MDGQDVPHTSSLRRCTRFVKTPTGRLGGGYSGFQLTRMIEWLQKSKPQKFPRASNETQENPWTKINPQKNRIPDFQA